MTQNKVHYWQNKIAAWLNESPIKVFDIVNRDEIAKDILKSFSGLDFAVDTNLVQTADHIASGLTRAILPADFSKLDEIQLKHPLVKDKSLSFDINNIDVQKLKNEIKTLLETDLSYLTKETVPEEKAKQIFNYLFFAFSKKLRNTKDGEIAKLGALWEILPADTRMPDHSMWHHFGLTSAIYSSLEVNQGEKLSMVVYSITPVQEFIGKARKLRDYWTGSVLLSYLAFTGITKVCEELGPDHILYPSLQNQALLEQWLSNKDGELAKCLEENSLVLSKLHENSKGIASFPNKFVFICNSLQTEEICAEIGKSIDEEWKETSDIVKEYIGNRTSSKDSADFGRIWDNAIDKYWKYSWAATSFATIENEQELKELLPEIKWKEEFNTMSKFNKVAKENGELVTSYDVSNLYGTTHSLVQGLLAAGKNKPVYDTVHHPQNGEKCPLCGENEVLNTFVLKDGITAKEYNENVKSFWDKLRKKENIDDDNFTQVGKNERLCAVCSLKRFLPVALKNKKNHLLYETLFHSYKKEGFPSTTEMASYEYLQTVSGEKKAEIVQKLHEYEFETDDEYLKKELEKSSGFETKYYAFLLMDGDKMGDLINGETTEAGWNDVLNIKSKENTPFTDRNFADKRRTINPALHAMISDSLNNFARYGVQPLVNASGGRLIYAGGDDVCAILPLSTAFETADKIRQVYQLSYAQVTDKGSEALLKNEQHDIGFDTKPSPNMEKIVMHLGHSENQDKTRISLSGAIIIAHHKQPLKEVIADAHKVLDGVAKDKSGRNSLAIRLKKRSGGDRDMWFRWEEKNIFADDKRTSRESFENVIKAARTKELSASLLYKIEELRGSVEPLAENLSTNKNLILKLFEYELSHSGFKNNAKELAVDIAGLCVKKDKSGESKDWYNPEAAIIANFLAQNNKTGGKKND